MLAHTRHRGRLHVPLRQRLNSGTLGNYYLYPVLRVLSLGGRGAAGVERGPTAGQHADLVRVRGWGEGWG